MSVTVNRPPRAPPLSGDYRADYRALYDVISKLTRTVEQLYERTGADSDIVASAVSTASAAAATAAASQAGADIPTSGGAITLNPANPLSYTLLTQTTARVSVAGHTRTGAAAALVAATVAAAIGRGLTYYVYYADAGNAGGAQTFLAHYDLSVVTGTAGYRIIGTVLAPEYSYGGRYGGSGVQP